MLANLLGSVTDLSVALTVIILSGSLTVLAAGEALVSEET